MRRTATVVRGRVSAPVAEVHDLALFRDHRHQGLLEVARELMVEGREEEALEACFEALRLKHDAYEAVVLAGTLLSMLGQGEAAVVYLREAVRLVPDRADAYYDLGSTLLDIDRAAEALVWLELGAARLGERRDDLVDFMYSARVEALAELGRVSEARTVLAEARHRSEDPLQLLDEAQRMLDDRGARPNLRVL